MRYLFILSGVVCLSFMLLPGCAPQADQQAEPVAEEAPSTEADVEAILNVAREECAAAIAGETERSIAILTDDTERIPPNEPPVRGEMARQDIQSSHDQYAVDLKYSNQEVGVDGDLAYHRYSYELSLTPNDGGDSINMTGAGIQILKRQQDGSWKIFKDIWNSDKPADEETTT